MRAAAAPSETARLPRSAPLRSRTCRHRPVGPRRPWRHSAPPPGRLLAPRTTLTSQSAHGRLGGGDPPPRARPRPRPRGATARRSRPVPRRRPQCCRRQVGPRCLGGRAAPGLPVRRRGTARRGRPGPKEEGGYRPDGGRGGRATSAAAGRKAGSEPGGGRAGRAGKRMRRWKGRGFSRERLSPAQSSQEHDAISHCHGYCIPGRGRWPLPPWRGAESGEIIGAGRGDTSATPATFKSEQMAFRRTLPAQRGLGATTAPNKKPWPVFSPVLCVCITPARWARCAPGSPHGDAGLG